MAITKEGLIKRRQTHIDKYGSWEAYIKESRKNGQKGARVYAQQQKDGTAKPRGFAVTPLKKRVDN